jgi:hypothetical protein
MKVGPFSILFAVSTSLAIAQGIPELVMEQPPFRVYSAFWPNLHNVLWAEAWARRPSSTSKPSPAGKLPEPLGGELTAAERRAWDAAVQYYDRELADLHLLFEMGTIRQALIALPNELPKTGLKPAHHQVLERAAPIYRKYWWPEHDRANRAWIERMMSDVASLTPAVPERLARLYGSPWFTTSARVDVVRVGPREGAFTSLYPAPAHITISSGKFEDAGWMGAEVLFHESSHALAGPVIEAFGAESRAQGKNTRDLWHAALFYMTGEVVRQALASRGVSYEPYLYATSLLDRAWPEFKTPIETYCRAYVDGETSKADAIKRMVSAVK